MITGQLPPSEIIDQALVLGKKYFVRLVFLGCIPILGASQLAHMSRIAGAMTTVKGLGCLLGAYALTALAEAVLVLAAWQQLNGELNNALLVWARVLQRAPGIVIAYTIKWVMLVLGTTLFIVPGFYLIALYFAVPGVLAIEDIGVRAAFARSRTLSHGNLMRIFLSVGVFYVVTVVVSRISVIGLPSIGASTFVTRLVGVVWVLAVSPFRAALVALVYARIRILKEGYDLDQLMSTLPGDA